jgi:ParB family chromosome partitioning protein
MPTTDSRSTIRRKLGRGLGSLISAPVRIDVTPAPAASPADAPPSRAKPVESPPGHPLAATDSPPAAGGGLNNVPVARIIPNPRQPRQHFDEGPLNALANSIRTSGVMQPVMVRPATAAGQRPDIDFELIAGERRWRAAQIAGLTHIPAVIRNVDDRTAAEFSLVENLQREDLNPLERAEAFDRLVREFHLTHAEIASQVGLDRSSISNHLRLLELDDATRSALRDGRLTMGHARALLAVTNNTQRVALAAEALRSDWSVREIERRAREAAATNPPTSGASRNGRAGISSGEAALPNPLSAHMADLQKRLGEHLGTKVHLQSGRAKGSGKLIIDFYSIDQFEGLLRRMDFEMQE